MINNRYFTIEVFNLFELFILLVLVAVLQIRHYNLHQSMRGAQATQRQKIKIGLSTVFFSLTILHRAVFTLTKLILASEGDTLPCFEDKNCNVIIYLEK